MLHPPPSPPALAGQTRARAGETEHLRSVEGQAGANKGVEKT